MKKQLEEEIRIFKINEKALYDVFNLLELSKVGLNINNSPLTCKTVIENIISDFEDKDNSLDLDPSKSLIELVDEQISQFFRINIKYRDFNECKDVLDDFNMSSKYKNAITLVNNLDSENIKSNKFASELYQSLENVGGFLGVKSFILSDISTDYSMPILFEMTKKLKFESIVEIISNPMDSYEFVSFKKFVKKRKELIKSYNDIIEDSDETKEKFLSTLLNYIKNKCDSNPSLLGLFQKYIDFNSMGYNIPYKDDELNITSTVTAYCLSGNLETLRVLYEDENYLNLNEDVRKDNDRYLINNLLSDELFNFIKFNNFKINDYTISCLAEKYIDEYENFSELERESGRESIQLEVEKVKKIILSKVSSKEEEKDFINYINKLQIKIDLGLDMIDNKIDNDESIDEYDDYEVSTKINRAKKLVNSNPHGMKCLK